MLMLWLLNIHVLDVAFYLNPIQSSVVSFVQSMNNQYRITYPQTESARLCQPVNSEVAGVSKPSQSDDGKDLPTIIDWSGFILLKYYVDFCRLKTSFLSLSGFFYSGAFYS